MLKAAIGVGVLMAIWTIALTSSSDAQTRTVTGQAGILGEWDVTATVTRQSGDNARLWSGPLSLTHVGWCSVDGPEEKTGELRIEVSDPAGEATATLLIDGTACTFKGRLTDGYSGAMACPDRPDVPMMLILQ
jgi:hypothetical protein